MSLFLNSISGRTLKRRLGYTVIFSVFQYCYQLGCQLVTEPWGGVFVLFVFSCTCFACPRVLALTTNIQNCGHTKGSKDVRTGLQARAKASDRRELHPQALFIKFSFRFLLFFCYASFFYFFYTSWQNKSKLGHSLEHICENKLSFSFIFHQKNKYFFDCSSFTES